MDLAIKFNEAGCNFYQHGFVEHAFDMFSGAMQVSHHCLESIRKGSLPINERVKFLTDPSVQRAFDRIESLPSILRSVPPTAGPAMCSAAGEEISFVWKRVISIDQLLKGIEFSQFDLATLSSLSKAVIYFNQALVLHLGNINSCKRSMERALTLYSMSLKELFQYCPSGVLHCNCSAITLTCAVLNNTGYLLHETGEFDCSRLCFARMNEFLKQLGPPRSPEERSRREEFGLNVLLFWRPLATAGAA